MKLYDFATAPNPRKVRVYLAEKGIEVDIVPVHLDRGEHQTPEFLAKNPFGAVPVLELDDGTCYSESLAMIEYLEEVYPDPPMIGRSPEERLRVRGLERACDSGVLVPVVDIVHNTYPAFAGFFKQRADVAENARESMARTMRVLNELIGDHPFVAEGTLTIADCTLYAALRYGFDRDARLDLEPYRNVLRWFEQFDQRPSARA
jgi:glutathione S-transferase